MYHPLRPFFVCAKWSKDEKVKDQLLFLEDQKKYLVERFEENTTCGQHVDTCNYKYSETSCKLKGGFTTRQTRNPMDLQRLRRASKAVTK